MYIKYTKCLSCCLVLIYCQAIGLEMKELWFSIWKKKKITQSIKKVDKKEEKIFFKYE